MPPRFNSAIKVALCEVVLNPLTTRFDQVVKEWPEKRKYREVTETLSQRDGMAGTFFKAVTKIKAIGTMAHQVG